MVLVDAHAVEAELLGVDELVDVAVVELRRRAPGRRTRWDR